MWMVWMLLSLLFAAVVAVAAVLRCDAKGLLCLRKQLNKRS